VVLDRSLILPPLLGLRDSGPQACTLETNCPTLRGGRSATVVAEAVAAGAAVAEAVAEEPWRRSRGGGAVAEEP
jgi:hypothetical protein